MTDSLKIILWGERQIVPIGNNNPRKNFNNGGEEYHR